MSNPEQSDVYFSDKRTSAIFDQRMGSLANKFAVACDDNARSLFGEDYLPNPSNVELTPYVSTFEGGEPKIIVRAWHETGIPHKSAVLRPHDTVVALSITGNHAYLKNEDTNTSYALAHEETLTLYQIHQQALRDYDQHPDTP